MYYETQWIDGVLMERFSPDGEWHCVDIKSHIESLKRSNSDLWSKNTALTARIADLERENAALGAKLARVKGQRDLLLNGVILMGDSFAEESVSETTKQAWKMLRDAVSAGKEAPDAQ